MTVHNRPFLVDYTHDGRQFSFLLLGPGNWAEAEAHLGSIAITGRVEGSDVVEIPARALDAWAALADALLLELARTGRADQMAIGGAAVLAAAVIACGLDRPQTDACTTLALDAIFAMRQA